jgi:hypothetical protein
VAKKPSARARSRAARQGALVRKVREGERGALAELLRKFPKRGRELQAERREEKRVQKEREERKAERRKRQRSKPSKTTKRQGSHRGAAVAELAEARHLLKLEKERADRLEREIKAALEADRKKQAERLAMIAEHRRKAEEAGFRRRRHVRWSGPPQTDLDSLEQKLRAKKYAGMNVHKPRSLRTKEGYIFVGVAHDPETGDRTKVRGYEIRIRTETVQGIVEKSWVFWGDRGGLDAHDPAAWYEEDLYAGVEREATTDMITAWSDA